MKCVTYIYSPFASAESSTYEFERSCRLHGIDLINAAEIGKHSGHGAAIRKLTEAYRSLDEPVVYADGADSFFLRPIEIPNDRILYSTEKACWEPVPGHLEMYGEVSHVWAFLNGGGYCGPSQLLYEFFDRYGLNRLPDDPGPVQYLQAKAYFQAKADGFPIDLDVLCTQFQTIAFSKPGDFSYHGATLYNNLAGSFPALIHGNGRTPMGHIYRLV